MVKVNANTFDTKGLHAARADSHPAPLVPLHEEYDACSAYF